MGSLDEHVDRYLALRRSVGFQLKDYDTSLSDFARYAQTCGETTVRVKTAMAWASEGSTDGTRGRRLSMVRGLARYLSAFDPATEIPPRGPFSTAARSTPHIFSESEIARVMRAAGDLVPARFAATMATLIGLMASTGLRPAEVRRLDRGDVDLAAGQITVWHSKSGRSRRLPVHDSTVQALANYAAIHACGPAPRDEAFFANCKGARLSAGVLSTAFRDLRERASITTADRHRPALIGDLRHTFAVTTILSWHRAGIDVQRQLPVLSAYLGHVNPAQTYWYLQGTPELMAMVAERLERCGEDAR
jgi:integrase